MKWLLRAVVVLAIATFGTILVLGSMALHGVRVFDVQFGARYIVVSISHVLPWLVLTDCIVIATGQLFVCSEQCHTTKTVIQSTNTESW